MYILKDFPTLCDRIYTLKENELIQSSQAGYYFSTQLQLKITVLELNNRFYFMELEL